MLKRTLCRDCARYVVGVATPEHVMRLARERARQARCVALRRDGKLCRSFSSGAGGFCFMHDPARQQAARAARARGGYATRQPRFAEVLRERMEAEIDKIIAVQLAALESGDERVRLHAADALLAAARGPRQLRAIPPVLKKRAWTIDDVMLPDPLATGLDTA